MARQPSSIRLVSVITAPTSAWRLLDGQLRYMRGQGFDVTLICSPGPLLDVAAEREGIAVIGLPMAREPAPVRDAVALADLVRHFRKIRPHIVHVSTPKAGLLGGLAAVLAGVPIRLYTLRGIRADGFRGIRAHLFRQFERAACLSAHRVYCISQSVRDRAAALRLTSNDKLLVLGAGSSNGVDTVRFSRTDSVLRSAEELRARIGLPSDVPVVGFVGRLCRDKGIVELAEAYQELRGEFPTLHLLLIGRSEIYGGVPPHLSGKLRKDPQIIKTGFLEDTAASYALMDVLALPTYREGFGNAVLEAGAMEIPVVATRVTGCVDSVVDGVTGTLVEPQDPVGLADALREYLQDAALRLRHGRAGRARAERDFQPRRIWEHQFAEYVELLRERRLPEPARDGATDSAVRGRVSAIRRT